MSNKQKFGLSALCILLFISILIAALNMSYFATLGTYVKKTADVAFDEALISCLSEKKPGFHPGADYKNLAVSHLVTRMVFVWILIINYTIISISLIWLYRMIKKSGTTQ